MKKYLLAPGPTPVPEEVLQKSAEPIIHHRTPEFERAFTEIKEGLKYIFQTENDVFVFTSSGSGAMEAAVVNLLSTKDKVLVVIGGKFGERWADICRAYRIDFVALNMPWDEAVTAKDIEKELSRNPEIKAVFMAHSETSTGAVYDIESIAGFLNSKGVLLVVDAISSAGGTRLQMDKWGIDVVVSGSQKGIMLPPGLSFISLNQKAWKFVERSDLPKFYWDLKVMKKNYDMNTTPYSPAIPLFLQLNTALKIIRKEGLENILDRSRKLALAVRAAVIALGLEVYSKCSGNICTAIKAPTGIEGSKITKILSEKYGITVAGGQGQLKGKIIRIAHIGYINEFDTIAAISSLEATLKELGFKCELGTGVSAALRIIFKS